MQKNMFLDIPKDVVSIEQVAHLVQVSVATVRNWVKTGYLSADSQGYVSEQSLRHFLQNDFKNRLHARANKSQKDCHNHTHIQQQYLHKIHDAGAALDILGDTYQNSLSDAYRNQQGIYYTPAPIVNDLFSPGKPVTDTSTFCDPCCGSGNFVVKALKLGFKPHNIYAFDTDPIAVEITKNRLYNHSGYKSDTIIQSDFLESASTQHFAFDFIYTNPPWGKKIDKKWKNFYGKIFTAGKSLDTSALFYFACMRCLKTDGEMGLLLPESFFNIARFEEVRKNVMTYNVLSFTHYGKAFKGLITSVCALRMRKNQTVNTPIACTVQDKTFYRHKHSFIKNPKTILNIKCAADTARILEHLFHISHMTLKHNADWGLGIVTGNNSKFIKHRIQDGYIPVYKGSDISNKKMADATHFIPADLSLYQQTAPNRLYLAKQKLIYKFISSKLDFYCDTQQRYILNSANMMIPHTDFPVPSNILADVLSSHLMNWVFKNIFDTHKILRKDLESLPIHTQALQGMEVFDENQYIKKLGLDYTHGMYRIKVKL